MALPARVFWKLENLAVRWGCSPGDIVGWATEGIIEIVTSIEKVQCGGTEPQVGLVVVCAEDVMPLYRGNRSDPKACLIWRIRTQGTDTWKIIADPAQGVTIELDDLLVTAKTAQRFEDAYDPLHRVNVSPGRSSRHDWPSGRTSRPRISRTSSSRVFIPTRGAAWRSLMMRSG